MLEDVEVVVRVLLDAAEPVDLRQHHRERSPHGEVAQGDGSGARAEERRELVADALAAHAREPGRGAERRLSGGGVRHELEDARQAGQAQHAQRVVVERGRRAEPQPAGGEVVEAAQRIDEVVAVQRPGQSVDGHVSSPQVGFETDGAGGRVG